MDKDLYVYPDLPQDFYLKPDPHKTKADPQH
jgi:hypothetical protein